jgi:hypothetical protein
MRNMTNCGDLRDILRSSLVDRAVDLICRVFVHHCRGVIMPAVTPSVYISP